MVWLVNSGVNRGLVIFQNGGLEKKKRIEGKKEREGVPTLKETMKITLSMFSVFQLFQP